MNTTKIKTSRLFLILIFLVSGCEQQSPSATAKTDATLQSTAEEYTTIAVGVDPTGDFGGSIQVNNETPNFSSLLTSVKVKVGTSISLKVKTNSSNDTFMGFTNPECGAGNADIVAPKKALTCVGKFKRVSSVTPEKAAAACSGLPINNRIDGFQQIEGWFDGLTVEDNRYFASGWACVKTLPQPVHIHIHAGDKLYISMTDVLRESIVGEICGAAGIPFGYKVDITDAVGAESGKVITTYAISPLDISLNGVGQLRGSQRCVVPGP